MPNDELCNLLLRRRGPVYHQVCAVKHGLYDMRDLIPAELKVPRTVLPNVTLADMLRSKRLSDDGKLLLACTLAHSVWKFYGTQLMPRRWTAEDIQFIVEEAAYGSTTEAHRVNPTLPFVPLDFCTITQSLSALEAEFVPGEDLLHFAPRVFALGVILLHLFADVAFSSSSEEDLWQARYNKEYFDCANLMRNADWPCLDIQNAMIRKALRDAVGTCLDGNTFKRSVDVAERKRILEKKVVGPLQYVVQTANAKVSNAVWLPKETSVQAAALDDSTTTRIDAHPVDGPVKVGTQNHTGTSAMDSSRQHNGDLIVQGNYIYYETQNNNR